jgi:enoyl reductase
MPGLRRVAAVLGATSVLLVSLPAVASADETPPEAHGGQHGSTIDASAYAVTYEPATPPPGHPLKAASGWTPPACWLAPRATPAELKTEREATWGEESTGAEWEASERDYYVNGHPHKDFELANAGKGFWWNGMPNPNRLADEASLACFKELDDWVPTGDSPPATAPIVTPKILAQSAYDRVRIPDKVVSLSPDALHVQTVNLNTWAWIDKADFKPVSVTARLNSLGIWATTTAKPIGLHLEAGTPDADLYPSSGDCPLNSDGSVGTKYQPSDANNVPPCGLTYRHSSNGGTFALTATVTWEVSWVGSGGTGGPMDNGVFATTQDVTVQEVQSVNR